MKSLQHHATSIGTHATGQRTGGAVILVVVSLMAALAFLGFFFYEWAVQERNTAEYFADSQIVAADPIGDPKPPFDFALEQLIVGTKYDLTNSALYGSKYAMLPTLMGDLLRYDPRYHTNAGDRAFDLTPLDANVNTGRGISVLFPDADGNGEVDDVGYEFDANGDGVGDIWDDNNTARTILNYSGAANVVSRNWGSQSFAPGFPSHLLGPADPANGADIATDPRDDTFYYAPDAGYTYPDINSMFLAHEKLQFASQDNRQYRVLIPSFFRPQYHPQARQNPDGFQQLFNANDNANAPHVLRPHPNHVIARKFGAGGWSPLQRFVSQFANNYDGQINGVQARSGDTTRILRPFPFFVDIDGDGVGNKMGVFSTVSPSNASGVVNSSTDVPDYELDVDTDGDGIRDAIWIDIDYPLVTLPDGRQYVPLFAFKVTDGDGLLNVNTHGNINHLTLGGQAFDGGESMNASAMGLSPSEVNLSAALYADPADDTGTFVDLGNDPANNPDNSEFAQAQALYQAMFTGLNPYGGAVDRQTMANMDQTMLLLGQIDPSSGQPVPGRFGEMARLIDPSTPPLPAAGITDDGTSAIDDDLNGNAQVGAGPAFPLQNANARPAGGVPYQDPFLRNLVVPPFVHPLSFNGMGIAHQAPTSGAQNGLARHLTNPNATAAAGASHPVVWPTYTGLWHNQGNGQANAIHNVVPLTLSNQFLANNLQAGATDQLTNEPDELVVEPALRRTSHTSYGPVDSVFLPHENEGLHLSEQDFEDSGSGSRLRDLMPFNLELNEMAEEIRAQFTTDSWEREEFSLASYPGGGIRPWEFNTWDVTPLMFAIFPPGSANRPPYAQLSPGTYFDVFPPQFTTGLGAVYGRQDPLRPQLRWQLTTKNYEADPVSFSGGSSWNIGDNNSYYGRLFARHKLDINRLLDGRDENGNPRWFDELGNPIYRNLTPHPAFTPGETVNGGPIPLMIHDHVRPGQEVSAAGDSATAPSDQITFNNIATSKRAQEWWARYDRQRLARDIYTMLYMLAGPDHWDPTQTPPDSVSPSLVPRIDEMAQFAVNLVDAMDRDNVMTRFEYDRDLSDGWQYTHPADSGDEGVVHGVEAADLTFSETMLVRTAEEAQDNNRTAHDDTQPHQFLYVELRNNNFNPVELWDETYRIIRVPTGTDENTIQYDDSDSKRLPTDAQHPDPNQNNTGPLATVRFTQSGSNVLSVEPGGNFLVSTHDDAEIGRDNSSDFYVDFGADSDFEVIVPDANGSVAPLTGANEQPPMGALADLDLNYTGTIQPPSRGPGNGPQHEEFYVIDQPYSATVSGTQFIGTRLLEEIPSANDLSTLQAEVPDFELLLQRRANPNTRGVLAGDEANDWVTIDRTKVVAQDFQLNGNTDAGNVETAVEEIQSQRRTESLARMERLTGPHSQDGNGVLERNHSLENQQTDENDRNAKNEVSGNPTHSVWQPHFDRDFSSAMELLSIPLVGPNQLTLAISPLDDTSNINDPRSLGMTDVKDVRPESHFPGADYPGNTSEDEPNIAAFRFLKPDPDYTFDPQNPVFTDADTTNNNRWHRLLAFLKITRVVDETNRVAGTLHRRTPGKVNLNTIRHPHVLAALIDDVVGTLSHLFPMSDDQNYNWLAPTIDRLNPVRDWMNELVASRDQIDPIAGVPIPGIPGSRPFRALSFIESLYEDPGATPTRTDLSIEHTILRHNYDSDRTDGAALTHLGLLEARSIADTTANPVAVDYHTRNRLLAKVDNNTTTQSNVFYVWLAVGFFEAHRPFPNDPQRDYMVQIGGPLTGAPVYRMFAVVDRSKFEDAYHDENTGDAVPGKFDFRKFILHRKRLQ